MSYLIWNSPALPSRIVDDDGLHWDVLSKVNELASSDEPSSGDMRQIFERYNESSPAERDAIDAAFVWLTGYTFATIVAMTVAKPGESYAKVLKRWRKSARS